MAEKENLLRKVLSLYDTKCDLFRYWFSIMWEALMPYRDRPNVLGQHVVAFSGHAIVLDLLYKRRGFEVEARDNTGRTALLWAAERGNKTVAEWLLERGVDVNAQGGRYGNTLRAGSARPRVDSRYSHKDCFPNQATRTHMCYVSRMQIFFARACM